MSQSSSNRNRAIPHKIMVENEDRLKGILNALISEIDDLKSSCDSDILKNCLQELRSTHKQFRKVSLELSGWYDRNGSNASVDDDRRMRLMMIGEIYTESINWPLIK